MAAQNPSATSQLTVASTQATAIIATIVGSNISVGEDPSVSNYPTTGFVVRKPLPTSPARTVLPGATYTFHESAPFTPGQVVGYVQTLSGTTTFFQDENA